MQAIERSGLAGLCRQWASDATGRGAASVEARTGGDPTGARHLKKSFSHLFAQPVLSYPFIAQYGQRYPVTILCRTLGVSVSGSYEWRQRKPSAHEREDSELAKHIHRIFHEYRQVSGSPRVHAELRAEAG